MARWKLLASHYLNVPGTEWEYKEIDRTTGRPKMRKFPVPLLLDPAQPADWNYRDMATGDGDIIVCHDGKGEPKDIIFVGDPTPDMHPLDAEATAISQSFAGKWGHPIESLEANGPSYSEQLLNKLQEEVADVRSKTTSNQVEGMSELLTAMTQMMKQNQEMMSAILGGGPKPVVTEAHSASGRKV